ncbi:hypothetical protein QE152_g29685 [Popillia japonica]|uniref:Uncharacterized protein n=1 Tax=Popillia japonica TaxID=7064 RepID=A0AAW1JGY0_POPJA
MPAPNRKMETELSATVVHTPSVDYDLQCDIAYGNYLQALLFQDYVTNKMEEYSLSMNDQLSKYEEILSEKLELLNKLEEDTKEHEVHIMITELLHNIESKLQRNLKELSSDVVSEFRKILEQLVYASNHLYLNRVKMLNSQSEYDQLQSLLSKCNQILLKIISITGEPAKYQSLSNCLIYFRNNLKAFDAINSTIRTLESDTNKLALDSVSNILFENNALFKNNINVERN